MDTAATARSSNWLVRWASLGGILYVALFVIGVILMFDGSPDSDAPPGKVIAYYSDSSHRDKINIGWILAGLGVFFFLWFVASLRETMREATASSAGDSMLAFLVTIGGTASGAVTLMALGEAAGVRTMSDDTFQHQVFPGIIHANTFVARAIQSMSVTMAERTHSLWWRTPRSNPSLLSAQRAPGSMSSRSSIRYSVRSPPPPTTAA